MFQMRKISPQKLERACRCLKGVTHPTRLLILFLLRDRERSVGELEVALGTVSQSNLSQHLTQMLHCGLLMNRREGNQVFYRVADERIFEMLDLMQGIFCR
jgi:DNA-binding transcriptional ArsR family regulator